MTAFVGGSSALLKLLVPDTTRAMAVDATLALSSSDLTASAAYALAINLADDRSSFCRELAAALFFAAANLDQRPSNDIHEVKARARRRSFERLCVLAADGECSQLRRRALSLLPALPLVPKELVNRAIDKVAAFPKPNRDSRKRAAAAAALDNDEMYDLDELCVVGWRSDAKRQADEAAKAARERAGAGFPDPPPDDRATLAEASAGCVQLGLEDDSKHVRLAAINALTDLIWPHGPSQPAVTAGGRAVGLLIACCADQTAEVRKAALGRLVQFGPKLRLKAAHVMPICENACERPHTGCAMVALELLSCVQLHDQASVDAVHNGLSRCVRAHAGNEALLNSVRQAAFALGGALSNRRFVGQLGPKKSQQLGLQRQAVAAANRADGVAPTAEQLIAVELIRGMTAGMATTAAEGSPVAVAPADGGRASAAETLDQEVEEGEVAEPHSSSSSAKANSTSVVQDDMLSAAAAESQAESQRVDEVEMDEESKAVVAVADNAHWRGLLQEAAKDVARLVYNSEERELPWLVVP